MARVRFVFFTFVFGLAFATESAAFEHQGFKSGMSADQVRAILNSKWKGSEVSEEGDSLNAQYTSGISLKFDFCSKRLYQFNYSTILPTDGAVDVFMMRAAEIQKQNGEPKFRSTATDMNFWTSGTIELTWTKPSVTLFLWRVDNKKNVLSLTHIDRAICR